MLLCVPMCVVQYLFFRFKIYGATRPVDISTCPISYSFTQSMNELFFLLDATSHLHSFSMYVEFYNLRFFFHSLFALCLISSMCPELTVVSIRDRRNWQEHLTHYTPLSSHFHHFIESFKETKEYFACASHSENHWKQN